MMEIKIKRKEIQKRFFNQNADNFFFCKKEETGTGECIATDQIVGSDGDGRREG